MVSQGVVSHKLRLLGTIPLELFVMGPYIDASPSIGCSWILLKV